MLKHHPKKLFCFLLLLFFIPMLSAWYLFTYHKNWIHNTTNHGILIQPMLRLDNLPLHDSNMAHLINLKQWRNHWIMLYFKENNCDARCLSDIYLMGQTHKALGKFQDEVMTAYVAIDAHPSLNLLHRHARTLFLETNTSDIKHFFHHTTVQLHFKEGQLFLVDPNGFVMMYYPVTVNFEDVYQDLNHLLKLGADA